MFSSTYLTLFCPHLVPTFPGNGPPADEFSNVRHFSVIQRGRMVRLSRGTAYSAFPQNYSLSLDSSVSFSTSNSGLVLYEQTKV